MTDLVVHDNPTTDTEIPMMELGVEQLNTRLDEKSLELIQINTDNAETRRILEDMPPVAAVVKRIRDIEFQINRLAAIRNKAKKKFKDAMQSYDESKEDVGSKDIPVLEIPAPETEFDSVAGEMREAQDEAVGKKSKFKLSREAEKLNKEVTRIGRKLRKLTHPDHQKDKEISSFFILVRQAIEAKNLVALQEMEQTIDALLRANKSAKERRQRIAEYIVKLRFRISEVEAEIRAAKNSVPYVLSQMLKTGSQQQVAEMYIKSLVLIESQLKDHLFELTERTRFATAMAKSVEEGA